ncbi:MAG TPA: hypothetical protein PLP83_00745 [Candidatus Aminicenantes bacterium]|nr:hypothetical protein [Candidatus Aminicenantes bacterium]
MSTQRRRPAALLPVVLLLAAAAAAQAPPPGPAGPPPPKPRVFVDWPGGDLAALQAEAPFVEFVADLASANVLLAVAPAGPAASGAFTLAFTGKGPFQGDDNVLPFAPDPGATPGEAARGLAGAVKLGLLRYAAKTPVAADLAVTFLDQAKPTSVNDKWDFWVFSLSANTFLNGETQYRSGSYYASVSADRVTPALKIQTRAYGNWNDNWFDLGGGAVYESATHGYGGSALVVKSLSDHWSAGGFLEAESSTFSNLRLSLTAAPALEYDLFPYSESTRRQLRLLYRVGLTRARYYEETVYLRTAQTLLQESLDIAYKVVRPWGKAEARVKGSHFFHDFSKNRLEIEADLEFRIWRGLSFQIEGGYSRIRDLLSLSAEGATLEEILLRQRQLATGHSYSFSVGFNFSFGSTRSNVVNPRFGNGGRSFHMGM